MLEKVYMNSEDLAVKAAKISRCTSIKWMHTTTALQKQPNKKHHCEHLPGPHVFSIPMSSPLLYPWLHGIRGQRHFRNLQQDRKTGWSICRTDCPFIPRSFNVTWVYWPTMLPSAQPGRSGLIAHAGRQGFCLPTTFAMCAMHWLQLIIIQAMNYYVHINNHIVNGRRTSSGWES